jgi:hypothetical protein
MRLLSHRVVSNPFQQLLMKFDFWGQEVSSMDRQIHHLFQLQISFQGSLLLVSIINRYQGGFPTGEIQQYKDE